MPEIDVADSDVLIKNIALGREVQEWVHARTVVELIISSIPPKTVTLCTLIPGKIEQHACELVLPATGEYMLQARGSHTVHVCGNFIAPLSVDYENVDCEKSSEVLEAEQQPFEAVQTQAEISHATMMKSTHQDHASKMATADVATVPDTKIATVPDTKRSPSVLQGSDSLVALPSKPVLSTVRAAPSTPVTASLNIKTPRLKIASGSTGHDVFPGSKEVMARIMRFIGNRSYTTTASGVFYYDEKTGTGPAVADGNVAQVLWIATSEKLQILASLSQISIKAPTYSAYLPRLSYLHKIRCRSSVPHGYLIKEVPNAAVDHMHRSIVALDVV
ncbi:hypothetical protein NM688_g1671 [Phlebia brevispora]|uniref:Uncharacterized protein n=1 Tax=Phlebia brevispora TaxID=194682 RepID=A0ACC1TAP6_9APHY|nr:hypothetical protein NM688_g1671 [Phlebia brevispora]